MAGYIMTLNSNESLQNCIEKGIYSTIFNNSTVARCGGWRRHQEGTFADYFTMHEGDNIYFFIKRKLYGIGRLINIGTDCKYLGYLNADDANMTDEQFLVSQPLDNDFTIDNRCFCIFEPNPCFFPTGIDMDEVLSSNPSKFKMLRVMWKVSFIKIDDEENRALRDIMLKRNERYLYDTFNMGNYGMIGHKNLRNVDLTRYLFRYNNILYNISESTGAVRHEMAIEAAICDIIAHSTDSIFGNFSYVSHQVVASPFKPVDYMDKMDIFGYKNIIGYDTISKFVIIEIKKDQAEIEVIDQIMKYVDFVTESYAHGDYSMIEAYVVSLNFSEEVIKRRNEICVRNYSVGSRPARACAWSDVKLITYNYSRDDRVLRFIDIDEH